MPRGIDPDSKNSKALVIAFTLVFCAAAILAVIAGVFQ